MTSVPYAGTAPEQTGAWKATTDSVGSWVLPAYFIVTLIPLSMTLLSLRLTPLRVLLLVLFVPFLLKIIRKEAGRFTVTDVFMLLHAAWITIALAAVHGTQKIPFAGITMVEMVGGYLMGRVLIRSAEDFRRFVRLMVYAMLFLLPFAVIELITGRIIIAEIIGVAFETIRRGDSATGRMGLERVYAVFEHPILFGMFCSVAFANLFYLVGSKAVFRWGGLALTSFMTFASLSSAPLLACGLQGMMIAWDKITRGSWKIFLILCVVGYVTVDALSNRTPITILIETMTFNAGTGWTRIAIFEYGMQNAMEHPIFGIGFNDWERPHWLTKSVDNFWLLTTMRFGFVGSGCLIAAFVFHVVAIVRAKTVNPDLRHLKVAYLIAFCATCFSMLTAHIWGAVGVFVMFYLGAGAWLYTSPLDQDPADSDTVETTQSAPGPTPFSRFGPSSQAPSFARAQAITARTDQSPPFARDQAAPRPRAGDAGTLPFSRTFPVTGHQKG